MRPGSPRCRCSPRERRRSEPPVRLAACRLDCRTLLPSPGASRVPRTRADEPQPGPKQNAEYRGNSRAGRTGRRAATGTATAADPRDPSHRRPPPAPTGGRDHAPSPTRPASLAEGCGPTGTAPSAAAGRTRDGASPSICRRGIRALSRRPSKPSRCRRSPAAAPPARGATVSGNYQRGVEHLARQP